MTQRPIIAKDLERLPGVRQKAIAAVVAEQPRTVAEALRLPDVGRKTTRHLLSRGLLTDPEGVQGGRSRV